MPSNHQGDILTMSFLKAITGVVGAIAPSVANVILPGSGNLIHTLMRKVTGDKDSPIEQVAAKIDGDPALMIEFQKVVMDHEVSMSKVDAAKLESVNLTMRTEAQSDKWPQYSWRPFNGFAFPLTVIYIYAILPTLEKAVPEVPELLWLGWLSILGVATYGRGKEKRVAAGEKGGMLTGLIDAIRK